MDIFNDHPGIGEVAFRTSPNMKFFAGPAGEVYDVNDAFANWIGYNRYEFRQPNSPVTSFSITLADEDLETDKINMQKLVDGDMVSYKVRKHLIPKGSTPRLVELTVMRYPLHLTEPFKFFVIHVQELDNGRLAAIQELMASHKLQNETLEKVAADFSKVSEAIETLKFGNIGTIIEWSVNNKMWAAPIWGLLAFLLFGRSILEIFAFFVDK